MESLNLGEKPITSLRKASEADMQILLKLATSMPNTDVYSPLIKEEEWRQEMENGTVYLIRNGNEVVGCFSYEQKSPTHIYISEISVSPAFQGKGIARDILTKFIAEHPEASRIDLTTHPDNSALRLYQSLGFEIESRKEDYYGDGQPRLILALSR